MDEAELELKLEAVRRRLTGLGSALVAFSGGVDSALLAALAAQALPGRVAAALVEGASLLPGEARSAAELARGLGLELLRLPAPEMTDPVFRANGPDRCYRCKRLRLEALAALAAERALAAVVEGSNLDDRADYRPGARAVRELGAVSPLDEAGLTKAEVRVAARRLDLPVWDAPAGACLASRVPYGVPLTEELLGRIGRAEDAVRRLGFPQIRLRHHDEVARIEVPAGDLVRLAATEVRLAVLAAVRAEGYRFVAADLAGYRMGSLNFGPEPAPPR